MPTTVLQTRVDSEIKIEADKLFKSLGIDTATAIRLFLKQAINQQTIPFQIVVPQYDFNQEVLDAIEEARNISKDPKIKTYSCAKELLEDCDNDL